MDGRFDSEDIFWFKSKLASSLSRAASASTLTTAYLLILTCSFVGRIKVGLTKGLLFDDDLTLRLLILYIN